MFVVIAALAALASCSKVELAQEGRVDRAITFEMARLSASTKADTTDYNVDYQNIPFGSYAWYKSTNPADDTLFMNHQKIVWDGTVWKSDGVTYYWPSGGSLDFICYSPYIDTLPGVPVVSENSINWPSWDVAAHPTVDVMYSTKAVGQTANTTTYFRSGVPVLFHHALARVAVTLRLAYSEVVSPTGDRTKWEVTVHGMTLKNLYSEGSLTLNLNADGKNWDRPDSLVWTPSGARTDLPIDVSGLSQLDSTDTQNLGAAMLVLPQMLDSTQTIALDVTIRTYRDTGSGWELFLTEPNVPVNVPLAAGTLKSWGMNQSVSYSFVLSPSLSKEDSTDPTVEDPVVITFDPAVGDWEKIEMNAKIDL